METRSAPKGRIEWTCHWQMPRATSFLCHALSPTCDDRHLKAAIRFAVGNSIAGTSVSKAPCHRLIALRNPFSRSAVSPPAGRAWGRCGPGYGNHCGAQFSWKAQAIDWTVEERAWLSQ